MNATAAPESISTDAAKMDWVVETTTPSTKKVVANTKRYTKAEKGRVRTGRYKGLVRTPNEVAARAALDAAAEAREEARSIIATLGEVPDHSPFAMPGTVIAAAPKREKPATGPIRLEDAVIDSQRLQRIKALALARLDSGRNSTEDLEAAAADLGLSAGHVRRLVTEFIKTGRLRPTTERPKITVPDLWRLKIEYFTAKGNAALAYKFLTEEELGGMSLRTFQRFIDKEMDPALRAAAKGGHRAMVKHQMFNREVVPHRAYAYSVDHTKLDIQMLPERGVAPIWPWMTSVQDIQTGVVLAFKLSAAEPNTQTTIDTLVEAVQGWTTSDGHYVGGKPLFIRSDNGGDFISHALDRHLTTMEIDRQFTQPYSSWANPVERTHKIIDEDFSPQFPGFCAGGADAYTQRANRLPVDKKSLLTLEMGYLKFQRLFADLNAESRKSKGGRSRLDVWIAQDKDGYQPPRATKDEIVYAMSKRCDAKLQHYGIHARREVYKSARLGELLRSGVETVEVRYHDSDLDHVEVFHDGEWVCTATRYQKDSDQAGIVARRQAQNDEVRALLSEATRQRSLRTLDELRASGRFDEDELPAIPEALYTVEATGEPEASDQTNDAYARAAAALGLAADTTTDPATGFTVNTRTGEVSA